MEEFEAVRRTIAPDPCLAAKCASLFAAHACFFNPAASGPPPNRGGGGGHGGHGHGHSHGHSHGHGSRYQQQNSQYKRDRKMGHRETGGRRPPTAPCAPPRPQSSITQKVQGILNKISDANYVKLAIQCKQLVADPSAAATICKQIFEHGYKQGNYHTHFIHMLTCIGVSSELAQDFIRESLASLRQAFGIGELRDEPQTEDYDSFCERMKLKLHVSGRVHMMLGLASAVPSLDWPAVIKELEGMWASHLVSHFNIFSEMFLDTISILLKDAASAPAIRRIANDVVDAKERVPSMRMLFKAQDMLDALGRCRFAMA